MNTLLKPLNLLLGLILAGVVGYALLNHFAPGLTGKVDRFIADQTKWTEEAIQANPLKYLDYSKRQMETQKIKLQEVVKDIISSVEPLNQQIQERAEELGKTEVFLREGRTVFQTAQQSGQAAQPIPFAGRTYPDLATFKKQLELLFNEKNVSENILKKSREIQARLQTKLGDLKMQGGNIDIQIKQVEAQIVIAKADQADEQIKNLVTSTWKVTEAMLTKTDALLEEYPIGTTADLLQSTAQRTPALSDPQFEAFLSGNLQ